MPSRVTSAPDHAAHGAPSHGPAPGNGPVSEPGPAELVGEAAFIDALRLIATDPAARGLHDDAAVIPIGGEWLVATHDMIVEGVHVLPGMDPADIAWRLVATNISDLAAKAARPIGVLLGYTLGDGPQNARFLAGLAEALAAYNVLLLGGDTVRAPDAAIRTYGLTALGLATHRPVPARGGARPGEALWLTGPLGAAMMAFEALRTCSPEPSPAYRRPSGRVAEGIALGPHVGAMMDVSDGLLLDATRMARTSGVTLAIHTGAVPIAAPSERRADALRWGDDYELLFTAPADARLPVPCWRIGEVLPAGGAPLLLDGAAPDAADRLGWEH